MSAEAPNTLAIDREAMVHRAAELIRLSTINPPGNRYLECARLLARQCREAGMKARIVRIPDEAVRRRFPDGKLYPRAIVLARWDVGARRTVHFNGHYDVVPAASEGWRFGPFEPRLEDGWLYGRGAADMKGAIASLLEAVSAVRRSGAGPAVNVEVSFTPDEETDSVFGAQWLVAERLVRADYAIICEGGHGSRIGCGHNGVLWFEVEVRGKAAHGSQPREGVNAVEQMSRLVIELTDYARQLERQHRFRNPDGRLRTATINVGGVTTTLDGAKINTVPAGVMFTVDRRVVPSESIEEAEADFRAFVRGVCRRVRGLDVEVRKIDEHAATYTDPRHPFLRKFGSILEKVCGERPRFTVSSGFNDSFFFAGEAGLPTLGWGPGGENCHGDDERVQVAELARVAEVYARFLREFAGAGEAGAAVAERQVTVERSVGS
ncbi:MAG: ArgE/DapE family deacylase [Verrucomicrobia bacterium]|nr:MAG: ArgE/DapE family deacylase [Verrucomicrobiota bacterium]